LLKAFGWIRRKTTKWTLPTALFRPDPDSHIRSRNALDKTMTPKKRIIKTKMMVGSIPIAACIASNGDIDIVPFCPIAFICVAFGVIRDMLAINGSKTMLNTAKARM